MENRLCSNESYLGNISIEFEKFKTTNTITLKLITRQEQVGFELINNFVNNNEDINYQLKFINHRERDAFVKDLKNIINEKKDTDPFKILKSKMEFTKNPQGYIKNIKYIKKIRGNDKKISIDLKDFRQICKFFNEFKGSEISDNLITILMIGFSQYLSQLIGEEQHDIIMVCLIGNFTKLKKNQLFVEQKFSKIHKLYIESHRDKQILNKKYGLEFRPTKIVFNNNDFCYPKVIQLTFNIIVSRFVI